MSVVPEISVTHPDSPPPFGDGLRHHVVKHVVEDRHREDWREIFEDDLLQRAKKEHQTNQFLGAATLELRGRYETLAGEELLLASTDPNRHLHYLGKYPPLEGILAERSLQEHLCLVGWSGDARSLWIVAGADVSSGAVGPYEIVSMYRIAPGEPDHVRALKLRERMHMQTERGLQPVECPGFEAREETE